MTVAAFAGVAASKLHHPVPLTWCERLCKDAGHSSHTILKIALHAFVIGTFLHKIATGIHLLWCFTSTSV